MDRGGATRATDRSAPASRPARPATCTSAACARRCSTGCSPAGTAASTSCASTTPISSATSRRRWRRSCTASAGWASTGTRGPRWAARTRPYFQSQRGARYQAAVDQLLASGHAYRDYATRRGDGRRAQGGRGGEAASSSTAGAGWPTTAEERARFEAEGRKAVVRLKMPREGKLLLPRPGARHGRVRVGAGGRPRHPARRRVVHLSPGQRGRRPRLRASPTSSGPRSTCRTRRARCSSLEALGYPLPALRPPALRRRAGLQAQAVQAQAGRVPEEPRLREGPPARHWRSPPRWACRPRPRPSTR